MSPPTTDIHLQDCQPGNRSPQVHPSRLSEIRELVRPVIKAAAISYLGQPSSGSQGFAEEKTSAAVNLRIRHATDQFKPTIKKMSFFGSKFLLLEVSKAKQRVDRRGRRNQFVKVENGRDLSPQMLIIGLGQFFGTTEYRPTTRPSTCISCVVDRRFWPLFTFAIELIATHPLDT